MAKFALLLASGVGSRAGGDVPKQFRLVAGRPLFYWSMLAFSQATPEENETDEADGQYVKLHQEKDSKIRIVAVVHPDHLHRWRSFWESLPEKDRIPHTVVPGGASRIESVKCGLSALHDVSPYSLVAVHDAARPLVSPSMIEDGFRCCAEERAAAIPVIPATDSLRYLERDGIKGFDSRSVDRVRYVAVQTPQIAPLDWLRDAYALEMKPSFTDDASILEAAGYPVILYPGIPENMKVTTPVDFTIAEALLRLHQ